MFVWGLFGWFFLKACFRNKFAILWLNSAIKKPRTWASKGCWRLSCWGAQIWSEWPNFKGTRNSLQAPAWSGLPKGNVAWSGGWCANEPACSSRRVLEMHLLEKRRMVSARPTYSTKMPGNVSGCVMEMSTDLNFSSVLSLSQKQRFFVLYIISAGVTTKERVSGKDNPQDIQTKYPFNISWSY